MDNTSPEVGFLVSYTGQICKAEYPDFDDAYCKYTFVYGSDWELTSGVEEGVSQICKKSYDCQSIVWNLPLEVCFKSTNPHGWPRIVFSVYSFDSFGNDVIRGYGMCHLPVIAGSSTMAVSTFVPVSSSMLQKMTSWLTGRRPEYIDPRVLAYGEGREVTRVMSCGKVWLKVNMISKDFHKHGFDNSQREEFTENISF